MSRIQVDIPDAVLEEAKAKEIKSLRNKVARLEKKIFELESKLTSGKRAIEQAKNLRLLVADTMDLYSDPWDDE